MHLVLYVYIALIHVVATFISHFITSCTECMSLLCSQLIFFSETLFKDQVSETMLVMLTREWTLDSPTASHQPLV